MSAPETKDCEICGEPFTRDPSSEGSRRWAERKYCGRICSYAARRKPVVPTAGGRRKRSGNVLPIKVEPAPRIVNGVWRPNAPGWPARPHIPAHLRREVSA